MFVTPKKLRKFATVVIIVCKMKSYEQTRRDADYDRYEVEQAQPLLEYLLTHVNNQSRSKIKAILKGKGIMVNGKTVSQFDYPPGEGYGRVGEQEQAP